MDRFILKYINIFNALFLLTGLLVSIFLADNTQWLDDSYSYLATYQRARLIFCSLLIISALTNFIFVYKALDFYRNNYFLHKIEKFSIKLVQIMFWLSYFSLALAGIFPLGSSYEVHLFFGVAFFLFQIFAIFAVGITFLYRFRNFAIFSLIVSLMCMIGVVVLFYNFPGVLILETYAIFLFALWILILYRRILTDPSFSLQKNK